MKSSRLRHLLLESLEDRRLLAVTQDADGWTSVEASADTRVVYVSSSLGSDTNDGFSLATPVRSLAVGKSLMRDGYPDWLLLKKGDVWHNETFGGQWSFSGRSQQEPMLVSSYGEGERPLIKPASGKGGLSFDGVSNLSIIGIHFYAHTRNPEDPGFVDSTPSIGLLYKSTEEEVAPENILLEDIVVEMTSTAISVQAKPLPLENFVLRRSVIVDSYNSAGDGHSQGLWIAGTDGILLEENVFDHNGWYGDRDTGGVVNGVPTKFNQGLYISVNPNILSNNYGDQRGNIIVRGNIVTRSSASGIQLRPGGDLVNNLFVRNPYVALGGGSFGDLEPRAPDGVDAVAIDNVILEANDISSTEPNGRGLWLRNIRSSLVKDNIIAHDISRPDNTFGLSTGASGHATPSHAAEGNIFYKWYRGAFYDPHGHGLDSEVNNYWWDADELNWPITGTNHRSEDTTFFDPERSIATYQASLGGTPSFEAFITEARRQSRDNWRPEYTADAVNNYIREGFEIVDEPADLVGRTGSGQWWVAESQGDHFQNRFWGAWSGDVTWGDGVPADMNGDGKLDFLARTGKQWWVARSLGDRFASEYWGEWSDAVTWEDINVADVNGDGMDDLVGRTSGQWWVSLSDGTRFSSTSVWGRWSDDVPWSDVHVADVDGDGLDDIVGRSGGNWLVARSTGTSFIMEQWGNWSSVVQWENVTTGDFNGDGKADIAGRTGTQWWVSLSHGTAFGAEYWGDWSQDAAWVDVVSGDFNRDGRTDIAGRKDGVWWVAESNGDSFTTKRWASWSESFGWSDVQVADFNGDRRDDIAARGANGEWWVAESHGEYFLTTKWGHWSAAVQWHDVHATTSSPPQAMLADVPFGGPMPTAIAIDTERLLGDLDWDGEVSFADFLVLAVNFGQSDIWWTGGDIDGDSVVDFQDFLLLAANFGTVLDGDDDPLADDEDDVSGPAAAAADTVFAGA